MEEETIWMTNMEELLAADTDGSYSEKIVSTLTKEAGELKLTLDKGLPPDEFKGVDQIYQAVITARTIVEQTWQSLHGNPLGMRKNVL